MKTLLSIAALLALFVSVATASSFNHATPIADSVVMPDFPEEAQMRGIQGIVRVECIINDRGEVVSARIVQSAHPLLNQSTLQAVRRWQFSPATVEGEAVYSVVIVPIRYTLEQNRVHNQDKEMTL